MNQPVLNISDSPPGKDPRPLKREKKGSTPFQNLVLGLNQEGTEFEGQIKPFSGRGGNPTRCAQKNLHGQSHFGIAPSKLLPQGGKIMGGKGLLSYLQGTQPKAATISPSSPQKKRQNSEGGGNPAGRPKGPPLPRAKPNSVRLSSFWPKGNKGKGKTGIPHINHLPLTSSLSLSPSLKSEVAFLGAGFQELVKVQGKWQNSQNLVSTLTHTVPQGQQILFKDSPLGLAPALQGRQGLKFEQSLLSVKSILPYSEKNKGETLSSPRVNLKPLLGTKGERLTQTAKGLESKQPLQIFRSWGSPPKANPGISRDFPLNKTQVEVVEASPSKLTLILQPSQGEGPSRLEVNLPQVDSFLNRVALQSLKDTYKLRSKKGEVTAKNEMSPADQLHLKLSLKKGRIIGEIIALNPKVKKIINQFLPQVRKAFSQIGIEMNSLRVSSPPVQRKPSGPASSKTSSSNLNHPQVEEVKNLRISLSYQPMKLQTTPIHHQSSSPSFHQVKDLNGLIDQLIGKLKISLQQGRSEATVALKPDYLGHLRIKLILEGKNIVGKILVDNPLTKSLIQTSLPQLKDSLTNLGIQVQNLEVSVGEKFPSPQKRPTPQGRRSQFPSTLGQIPSADPLYPPLGVNMAAEGGVDYLA